MNQFGKVILDPHNQKLMCLLKNVEDRRRAASLIRKLSRSPRLPSVHGGGLELNLATAMALRARPHLIRFSWSEEAARFVDTFAATYATIGNARRRIRELQDIAAAKAALASYANLDTLDDHQIIAVAAMTDPAIRGLCLFDEQGAGKTVMTIHAFDRMRTADGRHKMLVFAPKNMVQEWSKDFIRFLGHKYVVNTVVGASSEKYDVLHRQADVYVTNYETAHMLENPLRSLLNRNLGRVVMVVDESFFVKNRHTQRAAAVRRLRHLCDKCWVLCGTPAPNHALDVVHQFDVADGGVTFDGISLPDDPQELRNVIRKAVEGRGIYLRRLKHDVMPELPRKRFDRVAVPMEPEQRNLYAMALQGLVREVNATTEAEFSRQLASFSARRMALFQLCSHPGQIAPSYKELPGKLTALDHLLQELVGRQGEKVVIWSFFRYSLDQIIKRYRHFNPVRVDGTVADTQARAEAITKFQDDDRTMIFLGNPAAAGAGITLTRSRIAIYESFSLQAAHYLQSLDRIHRRGQSHNVTYYVLLCQDSIEEDEYERLLVKQEAARELFRDDDPRPMTRDLLLAELLSAVKKLEGGQCRGG